MIKMTINVRYKSILEINFQTAFVNLQFIGNPFNFNKKLGSLIFQPGVPLFENVSVLKKLNTITQSNVLIVFYFRPARGHVL